MIFLLTATDCILRGPLVLAIICTFATDNEPQRAHCLAWLQEAHNKRRPISGEETTLSTT